ALRFFVLSNKVRLPFELFELFLVPRRLLW
ncbi:MAG: hypothetical protein JWP54_2490, partial [Cryobacterium sp.]|nr:hypothetical protein [Cryobacterium sp.]